MECIHGVPHGGWCRTCAENKPRFTPEQLAVVGKANCGCVHHAKEGIPCRHDLALLDKSGGEEIKIEIDPPFDEYLDDGWEESEANF